MTRIVTACSRGSSSFAILPLMLVLGAMLLFPTATQAQISSFPYLESFETGSGAWTTGGGSYSMWTRDSGGTSSSNTGPNSGHNSTWYYYIETSSSPTNGYDYLTANFNFSTLSLPVFSFYYHMYGSAMGSLSVEVSSNSGASWSTVWSKSGSQQATQASPYMQAVIGLGAYANMSNVRIRFKGVDGTSFTGDAAVDYIQAFQGSPLSYSSSTVEQNNTLSVKPNTLNNDIIALKVNMSGDVGTAQTWEFTFNTNGTTNVSDITAAKLYYTAGNSTFSTGTQLGLTVSNPPAAPGTFTFSASLLPVGGDNYFWLAFDTSPGASIGNVVDAECPTFKIGATSYTPTVTAPTGNRMFKAPLAGTYTINPAGSGVTNYASFSDAVADMTLLGIQGPVLFQVASATYNEQFIIPEIPGSSAANTITFDGMSNNPVISYNTAADLDYVIRIDRADYITFKNLTINNNGSEGLGFHLTSPSSNTPCEYITIDNCTINMSTTTTDTYTAAIGAFHPTSTSTNYNYVENLLVQNCTINGSGSAIYLRAYSSSSSTYRSTGNRILNNTIKDYYYYGIYFDYYHSDPQVVGNDLEQRVAGSNNNGYGIYFYRTQEGGLIAKNRVVGRGYGINIYYYINYYSINTNRLKIHNNMVTMVEPATSSTQDQYGIRAYYRVKYLDVYNNSINIIPRNDANNDQYGLHLDYYNSSYDIDWRIRNNLVQVDKSANGGTPGRPWLIWNDNDAMITQMDNNVYFSHHTSGNTFRWDNVDRDWNSLPKTTFNANSLWGEAYYVSPTDLHARSHKAYLAGANLGILDDFDGEARGATPCIGADEYPAPPPEYDIQVTKTLVNYADNKWARLEGVAAHTVRAIVENIGLKDNPSTLDVGYATSPMNVPGDADVLETFTPSWNGNQAVLEFTQQVTGLAPTPMLTVYTRSFEPNDLVTANDQAMDTQQIFDEKVHGYEDFDAFQAPYFSYENGVLDLPWTIVDNNGGDMPVVAPGVGVSGSQAIYLDGTTNAADEWIITPAAELLPAASYRVGFVLDNMQSVPVSVEVAYGTSPNPASMTTFATFSNIGNGVFTAKDLWLAAGEAGDPYFNTPAGSSELYYIGIHVVSSAAGYQTSFDNIKLDDNPSPPPKIGYAPPGSPIEDFVNDDSDPIIVTANYKQPGLIHKTFQVATTTNIYGFRGDMLWDVESADPFITITKEMPDPTEQGYNFSPPRPRQFQTFTLTVDPSGLAPGVHMGSLTFYAVLFNDDFPPPNQGLVATNQPLVVPVELRILDGSGTGSGKSSFTATLPGPFTVAGSPYVFVDNQTNDPVVTLEVTGGQIDELTIHCFPNKLPQNLARLLYVKRYWVFEHVGAGWTANVTFPYADHEASMIFDRNQLRGVRQAQPLSGWDVPITGTTSSSDPLHSSVTVVGLNENNISGNIALAHPYFMFERSSSAVIPKSFGMEQNYPNPFNPSTSITYNVSEERYVRIAVYNSLGAEVAVLVDETVPAGRYEASFDASGLSSGTYIYRMSAGDFSQTRTMTLSK